MAYQLGPISITGSVVTFSGSVAVSQTYTPVTGYTGSVNSSTYQVSASRLDPTLAFQYLDTTGWDAGSTNLHYYLPTGSYDGQRTTFIIKSGGTNMASNATRLYIWLDSFRVLNRVDSNEIETAFPWYAGATYNDTANWRPDPAIAVWFDGAWTIDNNAWD